MMGITIAIMMALLTQNMTTEQINDVNVYSRTMCVVEIDEVEDIVTVADFNGYEWDFEGVEDWFTGDLASCIMCDNGTPEIEDDFIMSTNYCGWVDTWGYDINEKQPLYIF